MLKMVFNEGFYTKKTNVRSVMDKYWGQMKGRVVEFSLSPPLPFFLTIEYFPLGLYVTICLLQGDCGC